MINHGRKTVGNDENAIPRSTPKKDILKKTREPSDTKKSKLTPGLEQAPSKPSAADKKMVKMPSLSNLWIRGNDGQIYPLFPKQIAPSAIPESAKNSTWSITKSKNNKKSTSNLSQDTGGWNNSTKVKKSIFETKKTEQTINGINAIDLFLAPPKGKRTPDGILKFSNAVKINSDRNEDMPLDIGIAPMAIPSIPQVQKAPEAPSSPETIIEPFKLEAPMDIFSSQFPSVQTRLSQEKRHFQNFLRQVPQPKQEFKRVHSDIQTTMQLTFHAHLTAPPFPMPPKEHILYGPFEKEFKYLKSKLGGTVYISPEKYMFEWVK